MVKRHDNGKLDDIVVSSELGRMHALPLARFYRLPSDRRRTLARACVVLTAASAAVAFLPFRKAIEFGATPLRRQFGLSAEACVWAVEAAARRLPWRTMCIQKGLAVQRLLRTAGVDAVLHYGARRGADSGKLEAHVWISVDGRTVIGGEEAAGFPELAVFPDNRRRGASR
jgi:hypothetical protein